MKFVKKLAKIFTCRGRRNSQKGIALITTIIVSGIMLTSVSYFTKEMIDEVRTSTRIDNSLIAYYAAEAGIEEALLEMRYDSRAEISYENDASPALDVTDDQNNTHRCVNLDENKREDLIPNFCKNNKLFTERYYDLVMWYKGDEISNLVILKDDVAEIEIPEMNDTGNITFSWVQNSNTPLDSGYRVEFTVYDEDGNIVGKEFTDPNVNSQTILVSDVGGGRKIIRMKPWYTKLTPNGITYTEGTPLPSGEIPSITMTITKLNTGGSIGGPITNIESIGYYGGVARKIVAEVDRTSGSVIGVFDYAIYSGSDIVK